MTQDKNKKAECGYAGQALDFVYDEMAADATAAFGGHLAACTNCADEVSSLSASSLAVQEWRSEAFDPLATPRFTIPVVTEKRASFLAGILGLFRQPLYAASAAGLLLASAVGIYILVNAGAARPNVERAAVSASPAAATPAPSIETPKPAIPDDDVEEVLAAKEDKTENPVAAERRARTRMIKRDKPLRQSNDDTHSGTVATNEPGAKTVPEDLFGEVPETRDRSLRLTDLFAEGEED
ncbi:MAG: hypothetical protein KF756_07210 [Acidobacteria bacterium]|nr:hypothetical protein [Acidobacteriota bacterium]